MSVTTIKQWEQSLEKMIKARAPEERIKAVRKKIQLMRLDLVKNNKSNRRKLAENIG